MAALPKLLALILPFLSLTSPSSVATSGTNNGQFLHILSLALVPPLQKVPKQLSQELKGHVLESPCGAMPELENVLLATSLSDGRSGGRSEGAVGSVDDGLEVVGGNDRGGDEKREDFVGELWERQTGPLGLPVLGKGRDMGGDVETV